jgi:hypothetical protein
LRVFVDIFLSAKIMRALKLGTARHARTVQSSGQLH